MNNQKRKYDDLSLHEKFRFNEMAQLMIDTWVEDLDKKMYMLSRFNLDYRDDVPMRFLMGTYIPEKITMSPLKEVNIEEAIERFEREREQRQRHTGEPPSVPISWFFDQLQVSSTYQQDMECKAPQTAPNTMKYSDEWIVMQNRLLHAISNLSLNERRLILFLSPIVREGAVKTNRHNRQVFIVKATDFADEYNIDKKTSYKTIAKIADSILHKAFFYWDFEDNKKVNKVGLTWFVKCEYQDKLGLLEIILSDEVIEMLTIFDKNNPFTKYQKDWITKLGTYGIILLELILSCMYQKYKQKAYTIEYLREKFDCLGTYEKFANFKREVINKAIKEIQEHTPIRISYTQNKLGRAVSELVFTFENTDEQEVISDKPKSAFDNFRMTVKQLGRFSAEIAQKRNIDFDVVFDELQNVHTQKKYVSVLKELGFVPSQYYTDSEIKTHLTIEQIEKQKQEQAELEEQEKIKLQKQEQEQKLQQQLELERKLPKIKQKAEEFVKENKHLITYGLEKTFFQKGNFEELINSWVRDDKIYQCIGYKDI